MSYDDPTEQLAASNTLLPPVNGRKTVFDHLTTRDLFAGLALQGLLAAHSGDTALPTAKQAARWSAEYADELLIRLADHPFPG